MKFQLVTLVFTIACIFGAAVAEGSLSGAQAKEVASKCLAKCSASCPANTKALMEKDCKSACKKSDGVALYDADCKSCTLNTLGGDCFDCFGQCLFEMNLRDPDVHEPSVLSLSEAWKITAECMEVCPRSCPTNTFAIMERNCKRSCRKGSGVAMYNKECDACVIEHLGQDCHDCFGQCFRSKKYFDHKIPTETVVDQSTANALTEKCFGSCSDQCPTNTYKLMKDNCKNVCKNGDGVVIYGVECEKCVIKYLGKSCYSCFGGCYRSNNFHNPRMNLDSTVSTAQATDLSTKCMGQCPHACPADSFKLMEESCKHACKNENGVDFYEKDCEACVVRILGKPCHSCFGECFRDQFYYDPRTAPAMTVDQAMQVQVACLSQCPDACPKDTFSLMHENCRSACRKGDTVDMYGPECEACVIATLGRPCHACFGNCLYGQRSFSYDLPHKTAVPVNVAIDMTDKCMEFCPEACPADSKAVMETNCKSACKSANGVDFYNKECEACVVANLGKSCYFCFGQCFRDMQFYDPRVTSQSRLSVSSARKLTDKCMDSCSAQCPDNSYGLMERNCKEACKRENGIDFYSDECEACTVNVVGKSCHDCFGTCFRASDYNDPRAAASTNLSVDKAREYSEKCLSSCPEYCPSNTFAVMEKNCKQQCRKGDGVDMYDQECESCVIEHLGNSCYQCFGKCFRGMRYFRPGGLSASEVSVARAQELSATCFQSCPDACPADTFAKMEGNCKSACRSGEGVNFYNKECEDCVREILGTSCLDCYGTCFRNNGYLDPRLMLRESKPAMSLQESQDLSGRCFKTCPDSCPSNTFQLMKDNCKSSCREGNNVNLFSPECETCTIKTLGQSCYDCFGRCIFGNTKPSNTASRVKTEL